MDNRLRALKAKTSINEKQKKALAKVLTMEMISSEEEDVDEDDGITKVFNNRPLPFRSKTLNNWMILLDEKYETLQTQKGRGQKMKRYVGEESDRPRPVLPDECAWALK